MYDNVKEGKFLGKVEDMKKYIIRESLDFTESELYQDLSKLDKNSIVLIEYDNAPHYIITEFTKEMEIK